MKVYKDIFTGDEMFADSYKIKLVDDVLYEVYGKYVSRKQSEVHLGGENPSADEEIDASNAIVESGVDIILNQRLQENYAFSDKKSYTQYLKEYTKKIVEELEKNHPGEVENFKTNVNKVAKNILVNFKNFQFYTGESMDIDGMVALLEYRKVDNEDVPVMLFFKHGLREEKY